MTRPTPPGPLRVMALLARVAWRRMANRFTALRSKRKKTQSIAGEQGRVDGTGVRRGTAGRTGRSVPLLVFLGVIFLFNAVTITGQLLSNVDILVRPSTVETEAFDQLPDDRTRRLAEQKFRRTALVPSVTPWVEPHLLKRATLTLALVALAWWIAILLGSLSATNHELSRAGWSTEWLFGFPVTARTLFAARTVEYGAASLFTWMTLAPFCGVIQLAAGWGWWCIPGGLLAGASYALSGGALRLLIETWLRKQGSLRWIKNVQAALTLIGMLAFLGAFLLVTQPGLTEEAWNLAEGVGAWFLYTPFGAPVAATWNPWLLVVGFVGNALIAVAAVLVCSALVRKGLVQAGGPFSGTRTKKPQATRSRFTGILGKEWTLLVRDRNYFVQTLIVPLLLLGFLLATNPGGMTTQPRNAVAFAYGAGAYVLLFGGASVLAVETRCLWLLYTLPTSLEAILRKKATLWATVALAYMGIALLVAIAGGAFTSAIPFTTLLVAIVALIALAQLVTGLAVLGTQPDEERVGRQLSPEYAWLYMLVAGGLGFTLAQGSTWNLFVAIVLLVLLGGAIWQKAGIRLRWLLDETAEPARKIHAADGIVAAVAFFLMQVAAYVILAQFGLSAFSLVKFTFIGAGILTAAGVVWHLWRARIPNVAEQLGWRGGMSFARAAPYAVVGALACIGLAAAWLALARNLEAARQALEQTERIDALQTPASWIVFAVMACVVAPIVEELIFRGLLFRGLQGVTSTRNAALLSAAVFAAVHPPIALPAVFMVGLATAWVMHKTNSLRAAMLLHALYNGAVVAGSYFGGT